MYKVVIADDEHTIVTGLTQLLPWQQYQCQVVGTASNGTEALQLVQETKPDILFTDIRMPSMDGLTLIAALRSEFPHLQITILSGYPDFEYAQQAIRLGVTSYVLKPSKMAELEESLAKMVERLKALPPKAEDDDAKDAAAPQTNDSAGNFIISNAVKYIEEHYAEKLTLPEVADQVYVSQWHLSKLISKHTGQNFSDLLNGIRIRHAKELLADPSLKIWEISEKVGFTDVTHFSRIFKKIVNLSANEYRNQMLSAKS